MECPFCGVQRCIPIKSTKPPRELYEECDQQYQCRACGVIFRDPMVSELEDLGWRWRGYESVS